MSGFSVVGACPDCGGTIYEGHVSHRCSLPPIVEDHGSFTSSITFGPYDLIVVKRHRPWYRRWWRAFMLWIVRTVNL